MKTPIVRAVFAALQLLGGTMLLSLMGCASDEPRDTPETSREEAREIHRAHGDQVQSTYSTY